MGARDSRHKILSALDTWLSGNERLPVVRVLDGKRPANEHPAYFKEVPRLIMGLAGRGTFLTIEKGEEVVFDLNPGQVLFLAPYTWITPVPRVSYRSLGVVFREDSTRLIIHARKGMANGVIPSNYIAKWSTPETLGAKGEHLLQLLREAPPERMGERAFTLLMEVLVAEVTSLVAKATENERAGGTVLWQSVCDYISEHWSDSQLSRKTTAQFFNRHPNHFSRYFHAHSQQNFRAYVNQIRLERSMQFLRDLRYNVTDVAGLCGFSDVQYFIRCFHHRFGLTPGQYRQRLQD